MRGQRKQQADLVLQWVVMVGVLLAGGWGMSQTLPAKADGGSTSAPPEVIGRAQQAASRIRQLANAMFRYASDNRDRYPERLEQLYPDYVNDPTVFWHPGDSDPQPTTIDKASPNAINSAQISFEFIYPEKMDRGDLIIRDWSSANNDGYFILEYRLSCEGVDTIPPGFLPVIPELVATSRLRGLRQACFIYAHTSSPGYLPDDPYSLWSQELITCPRLFWHPGDPQPQPTSIVDSMLNGPESAQISFEYFGAGVRISDHPDTIIWRDNSPDNNAGVGWRSVALSGAQSFEPIYDWYDYDGNGAIEGNDVDELAGCMLGVGRTYIFDDPFCRLFEPRRSFVIDLEDVANFQCSRKYFPNIAP